ncbi:MAG TPA: hypothetical protein VED22_08155 [Nitrososphaerales archaeon]|nr:hypothetical protein [Nitrososphaerales archaeon]
MSAFANRRSALLAGVAFVFLLTGPILLVSAQPPAIVSLTSPNPQPNGEFGYSVAISGNLAVVGAPEESVGRYTQAGSAYVFNAQTGALVAQLVDPDSQYYGEFGYYVTIIGSEVVVGGDGNAYTFNARTGALIAVHQSPNSQDSEEAGYSVAQSGDVVVVGAPFANVSGDAYAGTANISNAATGALIATLQSPNLQYFGDFGESVAVSGRLVVVSAPGEAIGGNSSAGRAYVFNAQNGTLVATLASTNPQGDGNFGLSVAISGGVAIVGAAGEAVNGEEYAGRAYIFNVAPTTAGSSTLTEEGAGSIPTSWLTAGAVVVVVAVAAGGVLLSARRRRPRLSTPTHVSTARSENR